MQARAHILVGVVSTSTAWALATTSGLSPWALFAAIAGSLAPDIDSPHSWLGRRLPFISWPLAELIGHRGLTHSLLMVAVLAMVLTLSATPPWAFAFIAGYTSHIGADALTRSGVALLWPWRRRFCVIELTTGSVEEYAVVAAMLVLWVGAMIVGVLPPLLESQALDAAPMLLDADFWRSFTR